MCFSVQVNGGGRRLTSDGFALEYQLALQNCFFDPGWELSKKRPDVVDWGTVGETAALRRINTGDPVDLERYWQTNQSVGRGLMVDDIETMEELVVNARSNGRSFGFTFAISARAGEETGEFQGFVQFTEENELREKIEQTGLYSFFKDVAVWEVSYAKYPAAAPRQVASAVRQGCVLLLGKLESRGVYPRLAIIGATDPHRNPDSVRVLIGACFDPIGSVKEQPTGIIQYDEQASALDSVWLLNWNRLHHKLREKAAPQLERHYRAV